MPHRSFPEEESRHFRMVIDTYLSYSKKVQVSRRRTCPQGFVGIGNIYSALGVYSVEAFLGPGAGVYLRLVHRSAGNSGIKALQRMSSE